MLKRSFLLLLLALATGSTAWAQAGRKPVRLIVSFAPGGPVDFVARTIAEPLAKELGRPVLVENKAGANGAIGAAEVIRAEADGSTVWITSVGAVAINPALYDKLSYDVQRDLAPVSLVVNNVEVLVTHPKNPVKDAADFVARAKLQKEPTPIASSGTGSIPHLALLQLQDSTKIDFIHVPYNGMAPALTGLLSDQVAGVFADIPAVMSHIKGGSLKPLAIASKQRHAGLPDVKTFDELGIKAIDSNNWYGLFVSAKTPKATINALNAATRKVLADPATVAKLLQSGAEPKASSPEELDAILKADTDKWAALIKAKNIKANQ